jgi:hypothetical protein
MAGTRESYPHYKQLVATVKAWSKRSGDKVEVERNYKDDKKDELEGSKGIGNEKRT